MVQIQEMTSSHIVDELGEIKASLSELSERETELKNALIERGETEVDGRFYRATVSHSLRTGLDTKQLKVLVPQDILSQCQTTTPVTSVRVNSRIRSHNRRAA